MLSKREKRDSNTAGGEKYYPVLSNHKTAHARRSFQTIPHLFQSLGVPCNGDGPLFPLFIEADVRLRVNPLLPAGHLSQELMGGRHGLLARRNGLTGGCPLYIRL